MQQGAAKLMAEMLRAMTQNTAAASTAGYEGLLREGLLTPQQQLDVDSVGQIKRDEEERGYTSPTLQEFGRKISPYISPIVDTYLRGADALGAESPLAGAAMRAAPAALGMPGANRVLGAVLRGAGEVGSAELSAPRGLSRQRGSLGEPANDPVAAAIEGQLPGEIAGYHGSLFGKDPTQGPFRPEGEHGAAFYATTHPDDAWLNYADETGIEDLGGYAARVRELAPPEELPPQELWNEGVIYPVFLRNENPVTLGFGAQDTKLGNPDRVLASLLRNYNRLEEPEFELGDTTPDEVRAAVHAGFPETKNLGPESTFDELESIVRGEEPYSSGQMLADLYKELGYTGVRVNPERYKDVLHHVPGSEHHVIFDPEKYVRSWYEAPKSGGEPPPRKETILHGGGDFDVPDPNFLGRGEPGGIRPLGQGLYGFRLREGDDPAALAHWLRTYANKYGGKDPSIHAFDVEPAPGEVQTNAAWGREYDTDPMRAVSQAYRDANELPVGPERTKAFAEARKLDEANPRRSVLRTEELPIGLEEASVLDLSRLKRRGKWKADAPIEEILKFLRGEQ